MIVLVLLISIYYYKNIEENNKIDYLTNIAASSINHIIELPYEKLSVYLDYQSRNYDAIILFTTSNNNCKLCNSIENEFLTVSKAYFKRKSYKPLKKNNGVIVRPVLFFKISVDTNNFNYLKDLKLKILPVVYFYKSTELLIEDSLEREIKRRDDFWEITKDDGQVNDQVILNWINKRTNRNVIIKPSFRYFINFIIIICSILFIGYFIYTKYFSFLMNSKLWYFLAITVYFIFSSGYIYTTKHGAPFIGLKGGNYEYFLKGQRNQYVIEGFIISFIYIFIGISLIQIINMCKNRSINNNIYMIIIILIIAVKIIYTFEDIFKSKNFYNPLFYPPSYYIKGGLTASQGRTL